MRALLKPLPLCFAVFCSAASLLQAEDSFESLVKKLADESYAVRTEAKKELVSMCRKQPKLIERLAPIAFDENDEIERVLNVREVVADAIYVERGAIGFALNRELIVERLVDKGPASTAGIELGFQLLSVKGVSVKEKTPAEVYSMIHSTRPGEKLEMEYHTPEGEELMLYPVVAPRSTIRSDEKPAERKKQAYEEWFEKQRKLHQPEAD